MVPDSPGGRQDRPPNHFHERMNKLALASHQALEEDELFEVFAGGVREVLSVELVQILECFPEDGSLILRAGRGFSEEIHGQARVLGGLHSQAGRAMLDTHGQPVLLGDFSKPHDWADDELVVAHGARSGVALKVKKGTLDYGALCVFSTSPREYTPEEVDFLSWAAAFLADGLDRIQQCEDAVAWRSRTELLRAGAAMIRVPAGRDELLSAAALSAVSGGAGGSRPIADWCFADALEANGARPQIGRVAVDHAEGAASHIEEAFSVPPSPTASHGTPRAYATRRPELVDNTDEAFGSEIAREPGHRQAIEEERPLSYVCAPVMGQERFYGALSFLRVEAGTPVPYDKADLEACTEFAALVGSAIDAGLPHPDIEEAREAVRAHNADVDLTPADAVLNEPTPQEQKVLGRLADGMNMHEIGRDLHIDYSTVKTHRRHLRQKLGLGRHCQPVKIVAEARRRGWLPA